MEITYSSTLERKKTSRNQITTQCANKPISENIKKLKHSFSWSRSVWSQPTFRIRISWNHNGNPSFIIEGIEEAATCNRSLIICTLRRFKCKNRQVRLCSEFPFWSSLRDTVRGPPSPFASMTVRVTLWSQSYHSMYKATVGSKYWRNIIIFVVRGVKSCYSSYPNFCTSNQYLCPFFSSPSFKETPPPKASKWRSHKAQKQMRAQTPMPPELY